MMENNREKWVNEVLNSTEGMQPAAGNPFLYEKLMYRMQKQTKVRAAYEKRYVPQLIAVAACVLVLNCISVVHFIKNEKKDARMEQGGGGLGQEMNNGTVYNY
jgi:hypothetical protein